VSSPVHVPPSCVLCSCPTLVPAEHPDSHSFPTRRSSDLSFKYICLAVRTNLPAILNNRSRMVFTWSPRHFLSKQQVFRKLKRLYARTLTIIRALFSMKCGLSVLSKKKLFFA